MICRVHFCGTGWFREGRSLARLAGLAEHAEQPGRWVYRWFSAGAADEDDVTVLEFQVFKLRGVIIFEELAADGASPARRAGRRPASSPVTPYEVPLCPPGSFSALNACSESWAPASQNKIWQDGFKGLDHLSCSLQARSKGKSLTTLAGLRLVGGGDKKQRRSKGA